MTDKRVLLVSEDGAAEVNGVKVRVVPENPTEAQWGELANSRDSCKICPDELPDEIRDVVGGNERVFYMPNAGCC